MERRLTTKEERGDRKGPGKCLICNMERPKEGKDQCKPCGIGDWEIRMC